MKWLTRLKAMEAKREVSPGEINGVIREALTRYEGARKKYGPMDPSSDGRDFLMEAEEELLDCINYCVFQIIRLRRLKR